MPKKNSKKKNKSKIKNDSFLFSMLLATISILAITLKDYHFPLGNFDMSFAIFVMPIVFFVSNIMTKKFGFKTSLQAILISSLMIVAFVILIKDLVNQKIIAVEIFGNFISYFVSLFINLSIYYYILIHFKENVFLVYFNYIFSFIIYHMIYLLFLYRMIVTDHFWNQYFMSVVLQGVLSIFFVVLDSKVRRGMKKEKTR